MVARVAARDGDFVQIKLPSAKRARCGRLLRHDRPGGNLEHENISLGKAGRSAGRASADRARRGDDPVDHPMGGGEGRTSAAAPVTPWGQLPRAEDAQRPQALGQVHRATEKEVT
jgi:large subunit ribosomal protein L2